jgi:hypothetical protein
MSTGYRCPHPNLPPAKPGEGVYDSFPHQGWGKVGMGAATIT